MWRRFSSLSYPFWDIKERRKREKNGPTWPYLKNEDLVTRGVEITAQGNSGFSDFSVVQRNNLLLRDVLETWQPVDGSFIRKEGWLLFLNLPQSVDRFWNLFREENSISLSFKVRWCTLTSPEIIITEHTDQWRLKSDRKEGQREVGRPNKSVQDSREGAHSGRALVWLQIRGRAKILKTSDGARKRPPSAFTAVLTGCWAQEVQPGALVTAGPIDLANQEWEWEACLRVREMFCEDLIHFRVLGGFLFRPET